MARGAFRLLEMLYVRMGPPQGIEEAQECFLEAERSMLEQRRNGSVGQAIQQVALLLTHRIYDARSSLRKG